MTTLTVLQGKRTTTGYTSNSTITWGDLGSSPYGSWSNWTTYTPEYEDTVQIQLDDDATQIGRLMPRCFVGYEGDLDIQLKISTTGAFSGEESTINFVLDDEVTYDEGRYYRWTITITANSEYARPRLFVANTNYVQSITTQALNDVDIPSQSQDSSYGYLVPNDFGIITNVQATALQGDPYVAEGYYINYVDSGNDRPALQPIFNSDIIIDAGKYSNGVTATRSGGLEYDNSDHRFLRMDTDMTWEMDFNLRDAGAGNNTLFAISSDISGEFSLVVNGTDLILTANTLTDDSDRSILTATITATGTISEGVDYNVAVVKEGNIINLYLDGVRQGSLTIPAGAIFDEDSTQNTFGLLAEPRAQRSGSPGAPFRGTVDNIMISHEARYTGASYTPPTLLSSMSNILFLDGSDFIDKGGRITEDEDYIVEQRGGIPQVLNKNPLSMIVTDYQGNAWDGSVDLVIRGYPKIVMTPEGVFDVGLRGD